MLPQSFRCQVSRGERGSRRTELETHAHGIERKDDLPLLGLAQEAGLEQGMDVPVDRADVPAHPPGRLALADRPRSGHGREQLPALLCEHLTACTVAGLAAIPLTAEPAPGDAPPCVEHFTEERGFFKGKTYETWQEHEDTYRKVAQAVVKDGWSRVETDKDLGIITGSQEVTMGEGAVAPLNVVVEEVDGETVQVEAKFSSAGMQKAKTEDVRKALCTIVESVSE